MGGAILTSHFWWRHSRPLEIHEVEHSPIWKKRKNDEDTGQKPSPQRHTEFPFSWNPPTRFKKTRRETLPLAISQVELHSEFHEKRNFDRYSWFSEQWLILRWFWPHFDSFWVTIRNLLDFSIEVSIFFPRLYPVPLALVITTDVVLVFNSAWFSSYKPESKLTNFLARTIFHLVYELAKVEFHFW